MTTPTVGSKVIYNTNGNTPSPGSLVIGLVWEVNGDGTVNLDAVGHQGNGVLHYTKVAVDTNNPPGGSKAYVLD